MKNLFRKIVIVTFLFCLSFETAEAARYQYKGMANRRSKSTGEIVGTIGPVFTDRGPTGGGTGQIVVHIAGIFTSISNWPP